MGQQVNMFSKLKVFLGIVDANFMKYEVKYIWPETKWSSYAQIETQSLIEWRIELTSVAIDRDEVWLGGERLIKLGGSWFFAKSM